METANSARRTDTVNFRPLFVDRRPRTAGCELKSMDCGLWTADYRLRTNGYGLWIRVIVSYESITNSSHDVNR